MSPSAGSGALGAGSKRLRPGLIRDLALLLALAFVITVFVRSAQADTDVAESIAQLRADPFVRCVKVTNFFRARDRFDDALRADDLEAAMAAAIMMDSAWGQLPAVIPAFRGDNPQPFAVAMQAHIRSLRQLDDLDTMRQIDESFLARHGDKLSSLAGESSKSCVDGTENR